MAETLTKAAQVNKGAAAKVAAAQATKLAAAKLAAAMTEPLFELSAPAKKGEPKVWRFDDKNRPADAVFCGRPTKYGNPYPLGTPAQRRWKYEAYLEWLVFDKKVLFMELAGKDLWCFCAPNACHCDVLLKHYGHLKPQGTTPFSGEKAAKKTVNAGVSEPEVKYLYHLETKRVKEVDFPYTGVALNSEKFVYEYLQNIMQFDIEFFFAFLCNSQNRIIGVYKTVGTTNASAVFAREVIKHSLLSGATALIFAHNHPSGNTSPSQDDKVITRELILASSVMGLKVLDHVIIGDGAHYSFASQGLIQKYEAEVDGMKARSRVCEPQPTLTATRKLTFRSASLNSRDEIAEFEDWQDADDDDDNKGEW